MVIGAPLFGLGAAPVAATTPPPAPITEYATYPDGSDAVVFPEDCTVTSGKAVLTDVAFTVNGGAPAADLASLAPLGEGDVVAMTWSGVTPGCEDATISLAVSRADSLAAEPERDHELVDRATVPASASTLTLTMPARTAACAFAVDAIVGPPLETVGPDGSFYLAADREAILGQTEPGRSTSISTAPGGADDCAPADPDTQTIVSCIDGGLLVFFRNDGEVDTRFALEVDDASVDAFDLAPGGETSRVVPMFEDSSARVVVTADGQTVHDAVHTFDCEGAATPPTATITNRCASANPAVVLENPTTEPVTFTVTVGGASTEHVVDPNSATRVPVPLGEGASVDVTVSRGGLTVAQEVVTRDCEQTTATITSACASPGAEITVVNEGASTSVEVSVDGAPVAVVPLESGASTSAFVPLAEDTRTLIAVRDVHGATLAAETIVRNCVPDAFVLGVQVDPPGGRGSLPRTGSHLGGPILLSGLLIALGAFSLGAAELTTIVVRRRHT